MEELSIEICNEYQKKAKTLGNSALVVGARRELVKELQRRCGIPELWAINIVNGHGGKDYVAILEYKKGVSKYTDKDREYLEWIAQKEDKDQIEQMMLKDEMDT